MVDPEAPVGRLRETRDAELGTVTSVQHDRPPVRLASPSGAFGTEAASSPEPSGPPVMEMQDVSVFYNDFEAVRGTTLPIAQNQITAMIGPSGCGKSRSCAR